MKPSLEQYLTEIVAALGFGDDTAAERSYEFNLRSAHQSISSGEVMSGIVAALKDVASRYAGGRPDLLFYPSEIPQELPFLKKTFKSVVNKLYRKNVLYNNRFPGPPPQGAVEPRKLYEEIDDLIRTRIVCKYMDGPRFVCDELKKHCNGAGIESYYRELSTDAGYYAWHFYLRLSVELMVDGLVEHKQMWVEIQISTQLAEVITALTHDLYEARRLGGDTQSRDWKWDAGSHRFRSAYLGHGLHLLEGIIQNLKDEILAQPQQHAGSNIAGGAAKSSVVSKGESATEPPATIGAIPGAEE